MVNTLSAIRTAGLFACAMLLASACSRQEVTIEEPIITPTVLSRKPTPTPVPPPEWPELVELKQRCNALHSRLRNGEVDAVKSQLDSVARSAEKIASTSPPPGTAQLDMVNLFQSQLLKLAHSPRLSGADGNRPLQSAEDLRLYINSIEYAARNIIEHGNIPYPDTLSLQSPAVQ